MGSRGAAAALFRALRSTTRLSKRLDSSSSVLGRCLLDDNQCLLRQSDIKSALSVHCQRSLSTSSSASTPAPSRLFSADAAATVSPSKVVLVKDDAHYAEIMKDIEGKDTLAVVYFTAQWCGPCKQIAPYIDQLSQQFDDVVFLKLDVDKVEVEQTMVNSRIGVVPTFHFYKKGKPIGELTGAVKDKLKNLVESLRSKS
ncbi:unnamed protein product [Calypogeia fissa]